MVDTSGDAAAAALAGAGVEASPPGELQSPSFIVRLAGVDTRRPRAGFARLRVEPRGRRRRAREAAARRLRVRARAAARRASRAGEAFVQLNVPKPRAPYDPLDPTLRASCSRPGRRAARGGGARLPARDAPGLPGARVAAWPRAPRRARDRAASAASSQVSARTSSPDAAATTRSRSRRWPIELWRDHRRARFEYPAGPCSMPLGALVSGGVAPASAWPGAASRRPTRRSARCGSSARRSRPERRRASPPRWPPTRAARSARLRRPRVRAHILAVASGREAGGAVTVVDAHPRAGGARARRVAALVVGDVADAGRRARAHVRGAGHADGRPRRGAVAAGGRPRRAIAAACWRARVPASSSARSAILAAGGCLVAHPRRPPGADPRRRSRAARGSTGSRQRGRPGFAPRRGPAPGPVDGAGDDAFRALRPGLPALHVGHDRPAARA